MTPHHVTFLAYELHPPWVEGTRVLTRNYMRAVSSAGVEVSAAATRTRSAEALGNFDVRYVTPTPIAELGSLLGVPGNNVDVGMFSKLAIALRRQVAAQDASLVHAGFASHTVFSAVCRIPPAVPFVAHLFGKVEHQAWLERLGTLDRVDAYVTSSPRDARTLRSLGVPEPKINVISPVVYPQPGDGDAGRRVLGIGKTPFVVGYLGNVDEERLPTPFLSRLDEFADGGDTAAVVVTKNAGDRDGTFAELGNVTVLERSLSEPEKADVFAAVDVWVFPYDFDDPDTAPVIDPPVSVLEALTAGRPVVTTRSLSLPTYVPDGEGALVVEPGASDALIGALESFRDGDRDEEVFGRQAAAYAAERFAPSRGGSELVEVYERVLGTSGR